MLTEAALVRVAIRSILFVFALLALVWLIVQLRGVLIVVLLAIIFAAAMAPLVDRVTESPAATRARWRLPRAVVVLLLYIALLGLVTAVAVVAVPPIIGDAEDLARRAPELVGSVQAWLGALPLQYPWLPDDLEEALVAQLRGAAGQLAGLAGQAVTVVRLAVGLVSGTLNAIFALVLAVYMTADSHRIVDYLLRFLPAERRAQAREVGERIGLRLGGWVRGQLLLSVLVGLMTLAGLSAIGVPYAVLLALIAGIAEAIPMVGPIIAAVPAVIIAFTQSPAQGLLTLALYVIVQQLENHLIVPRVMGRAVELHPLAVILALLVGSELMGVIGAILAVPVTAALSVIVGEVRRGNMEREHASGPRRPRDAVTGFASEGLHLWWVI